jgi:hypothetical protein
MARHSKEIQGFLQASSMDTRVLDLLRAHVCRRWGQEPAQSFRSSAHIRQLSFLHTHTKVRNACMICCQQSTFAIHVATYSHLAAGIGIYV